MHLSSQPNTLIIMGFTSHPSADKTCMT